MNRFARFFLSGLAAIALLAGCSRKPAPPELNAPFEPQVVPPKSQYDFKAFGASVGNNSPCSITPNVGFQVPPIGNTTIWGYCLNNDLTMLDVLLGGTASLTVNNNTPSIKGQTNWITNNTAPTTILAFPGAFPGQTIHVICGPSDAFTSVGSSATIALTSAWSCTSSPSLSLTWNGSKWIELGRGGGGGGGGGGSSIFNLVQFGTNPAITGSGNYLQFTATPSAIVSLNQTGVGTSSSPFIDTFAFNVQGTDAKLMSAGAVNGVTGTFLCLDSNGGLSTNNCTLGAVISVFGRAGVVASANGDYSLSQITATYNAPLSLSGSILSVNGATAGNPGVIQLTGDLGGAAASPSVVGVNGVTYPTTGSSFDAIPILTAANTVGYYQINGGAPCGDATHALAYAGTSTHLLTCQAITGSGGGVNVTVNGGGSLGSPVNFQNGGTINGLTVNVAAAGSNVAFAVNGTATVPAGGTGLSAGTSGGVLCFTGSTAMASSSVLTANFLMVGGGAGTCPGVLALPGSTTTVLHGNASGPPSFSSVALTTDVSGILPVSSGGTNASTQQTALNNIECTPTRAGDIGYYNGSNWVCFAGNNGSTAFLQETNAGVLSWSAPGTGTVTGGTFTGGIISVTGSTTLLFTIVGTSGGVPCFTSSSAWTSSAALASGGIVLGGGPGTCPGTSANFTTSGSTLTIGVSGTNLGVLALTGNTSGTDLIETPAANGSFTFVLPNATPTAGQILDVSSIASSVVTLGYVSHNITVNGGSALAYPVNFQTGSGGNVVNGIAITATNPTGSNVQFAISGTLTDAGLASSYSGVGACATNTWASTLTRNSAPTCTQPGFSNLSGSIALAQTPLTSTGDLLTVVSGALARLAQGGNGSFLGVSGGLLGFYTPSVTSFTFPITVSGTVNSGGIPCFNSATNMETSAALTSGVLIKGGGAGACVALSSITDNGTLISTTEGLSVTAGSTSQVALTVTNPVSSTADIADFRNAGGTIVAKIDSGGNIYACVGCTVAGQSALGFGTAATVPTSGIGITVPTSGTAYQIILPGAIGTTNQAMTIASIAGGNVATMQWTTVGGGSSVFPLTVSGTVNSGGIPCFNSTTNEESSAAIAAGVLIKGGGAGACASGSLATDNGTALTYTGTGGVSAPAFTASGTTAGYFICTQGTDNGLGATNTITVECPTAVTRYLIVLPTTAGTANQVLQIASVSSSELTMQWGTVSGGGGSAFPVTVSGTVTSGGIPCFNSTTNEQTSALLAANGIVLGGGAGACPATVAGIATDGTSILELGVAGTSVGKVQLSNATSGSISLAPTTGALGTVTLTLPAVTDTVVTLAATQTLTNKSINGSEINSGTVALANMAQVPFDSQANDLTTPTGNGSFTYPNTATSGFTLSGTAPASVSTSTGTNAMALLTINGVTGGATSNAAGTAGIGSSPVITAGNGGAGTGTNAVGGAGGVLSLTAGNGGASLGTGANANGGSIVLTPGSAGTGGSGTAGLAGVVSVSGTGAGFVYFSQGSAITTSNSNIPANSIIFSAPTAVTAYKVTLAGTAASGVAINVLSSGVITQTFSGDTNHAIDKTAQTAAISTATLCAATAGTACGQVGQYKIHYNFWGSGTACSLATVGSVGLNFTWTDEGGNTHTTVSAPMYDQKSAASGILFNFNTALTTESAGGDFMLSTNGTIIQYATTYTACSTGTGAYNLRLTIEQLQ